MMKSRLFLLLAFMMMGMGIQAAEKHEAPIKHVTVFTNGAQVERTQSLNLTAGEQVVTFTVTLTLIANAELSRATASSSASVAQAIFCKRRNILTAPSV